MHKPPFPAQGISARRRRCTAGLTCLTLLALLVSAAAPGCGSCNSQPNQSEAQKKKEEEEKKKKEKPKPDFELGALRVQPSDGSLSRNLVKPGHWLSANLAMKANNYDFNAELESAAANSSGTPLPIEKTPFRMTMSRPAALPKGQLKHFETTYYVPRRASGQRTSVFLKSQLLAAGSGRVVGKGGSQSLATRRMQDYQYYFVVLAEQPDRYGHIKRLDSVEPPFDEIVDDLLNKTKYYEVVLPKIDNRVPVPHHPLTWTSIAYVLWDGIDPNMLAPDQRQAMLDWLHWGGQLIVSGPGSLDALRGSYLAPYLPADKVKSRNLHSADFADLNAEWSDDDERRLNIDDEKPLLGVELKKHPLADELPQTGGLVLERRVGRGRIVLTAFSLSERSVINWRSYDGFFNGCLLRRPPREFIKPTVLSSAPDVAFVVASESNRDKREKGYKQDARISTMLRYFSRDLANLTSIVAKDQQTGAEAFEMPDDAEEEVTYDQFGNVTLQTPPKKPLEPSQMHPETDDPHFGGYAPLAQSGIAGWNDYNGAAAAARLSLREAAGITIPKAGFVMKVLGVYLLILVPLNWGLFRLIGRVEWAWIAAPIIALVGAGAVVRLAQLDIGFARSRTDVAVLEAHGDYSRAHVTRYTALYTSLSTAYDTSFDNRSALMQPFAANPTEASQSDETTSTVRFRHDRNVSLSGFQVASNSTGMLHSEQMLNMGGAVKLLGSEEAGWRVENQTDLSLQGVGVLRKTTAGANEMAWIGELKAKTSAPLRFTRSGASTRFAQWNDSPITSKSADGDDGVSLWGLIDLATERLRLGRGEVRLIGWSDDPLPGITFRPAASQVTLRTMVLVHLRQGQLPRAQKDIVSKLEVVAEEKRELKKELDEEVGEF